LIDVKSRQLVTFDRLACFFFGDIQLQGKLLVMEKFVTIGINFLRSLT